MDKKKLSNTNLEISPIGFGVGGILGDKMFNEKKALNVIQSAIDNGINFFDTGSAYSNGNAELRLGRVLNNNDLDKLVIATKGGTVLTNKNKLVKNFSRESLTKNLDISLKKLGVERIDLFQLHSPAIKNINDEVLETLSLFKQQGKINHIGLSCDGKVLDYAIEVELFDTVMLTYNILEQKPEKQIIEAKKKGKGVLIKSPMAHGLYSNNIFKITSIADVWYFLRVLKNYRPQLFEGFKYRFINNIEKWKGSEIALKFVLENENIDCALIGTTRIAHLLSNIQVTEKQIDKILLENIKSVASK